MTEVSIVPRVRTETKTIQSPISKCGDNWWRDIRVRCAYRSTDIAFRTLPSLGDPTQVEALDAEFLEEILWDKERISQFSSENIGQLSEHQLENIEKLLSRAVAYIADAERIQKFWMLGFTTAGLGDVPPWALNGLPRGPVNGNIEEGHAKDCEKWKRLVRSALRNLRCAEEVAKKATIRIRNMEHHKKGRLYGVSGLVSGKGGTQPPPLKEATFSPLDPPPLREATFVGGEEDDLEEGELDLEEEADAAEPTDAEHPPASPARAPSKKKDNTLLIAGAAVLGLLAFSK